MEVKINSDGEIVNISRGSLYVGTRNTKLVKLTASDSVFSAIPTEYRLVYVNIERADGEQSGWCEMNTDEDEIYYYRFTKWDLAVPGELRLTFKVVNCEDEDNLTELTTSEVVTIVKNGAIAQPVASDSNSITALEEIVNSINTSLYKTYDVTYIDSYAISFSQDGYKTPAIYKNYSHGVDVNSTGETKDVTGILIVTSYENSDGIIEQTEILISDGEVWVRELDFLVATSGSETTYTLQGTLSSFSSSISDLQAQISANDTNITTLNTSLSKVQTAISNDLGKTITLEFDDTTYILSAVLKNAQGKSISSSEVTLPFGKLVTSTKYSNGVITLTFDSGESISVDIKTALGLDDSIILAYYDEDGYPSWDDDE